ncbi:MAG: HAMP domain-containing sensor histidine kinase [Tissierellia bacterium]|nr:HAMP domain-containing sensor histidine kinase [Tissierellia bacterium]
MDLKKSISLRSFFLKYFFTTILILLGLGLLLIGVFLLAIEKEFILPANAVERRIQHVEQQIKDSENFDPKIIPYGAKYILFSKDHKVLQGNMNLSEEKEAISIAKGNLNTGKNYYKVIPRKEGQCILRYQLKPRFQSELLNQYIPNLEMFIVFIFILLFLLASLAVSIYYAKNFNKELLKILEVSKKIKAQNLEFTIQNTKVKELNHILQSMSDMKEALKTSLKKQWEEEQLKKEQVAALAHDIKTPLTIIRGNIEILKEKSLGEENEYIYYALKNINDVEEYVKKLHEIAYMEKENTPNIETWDTKEFINEILQQSKILGKEKRLHIVYKDYSYPDKIQMDKRIITRAVMNVINNAIEYSPNKGNLFITTSTTEKYFTMTFEDEGQGFTKEDLKYGKEKFYQGDKSRTSHSHVGLGLYIVNQMIESHGGSLVLENSSSSNGAKVSIQIPIS